MRCLAPFVIAGALVGLAAPARAEEIFLCNDQRLVYVDATNRAARYEDPCVKAWFDAATTKAAAPAPTPAAGAGAETPAAGTRVPRTHRAPRAAATGDSAAPANRESR